MRRALGVAVAAALVATLGTPVNAGDPGPRDVHPSLRSDLIAFYDFDHPMPDDPALERDLGRSGTEIELINGGAAQRVPDSAYPGSRRALQTKQVTPDAAGNDDWKAGVYSPTGVRTLRAFNAVGGTTVMGWFKRSMDGPAPNTVTPAPDDRFNAIGLAGVLTGDSDGHAVRALLELIDVQGTLRLVALGRRLDGGASQTFAASADWKTLLPKDQWVHIAATFDFNAGTMALYRNGVPVEGFYTVTGDPWQVGGPGGPFVTTATDPRGIKIGGSFPQNTVERNPCDCRMDALMFLDRSLSARDVANQYRYMRSRG
ncbi:LamG-like jellyroll fold domain-containing protein [Actinoplanes sp. NPDC023714]|uniref:LamG-like jellyroll fold domain-containing protein n=1 Tax=Actinoplanes sp. NPDC023714 TaxID=3154322 RepID=UPI0033D0EA3F